MSNSFPDYMHIANLPSIEAIYEQYTVNPQSVDPSFQAFFEGFSCGLDGNGKGLFGDRDHSVDRLINLYRLHGHRKAYSCPLSGKLPKTPPFPSCRVDPKHIVNTLGLPDTPRAPLEEVIGRLEAIYCGTVAVECADPFLYEYLESHPDLPLSPEDKEHIFRDLFMAEEFESFIHRKYPGHKRFSLEGLETAIPLLRTLISTKREEGEEIFVLGMAHRGRLNVLANIAGKPLTAIFEEFEENYVPDVREGSGDVKYHMGCTVKLPGKHRALLRIAPNPSHLESVDPVIAGMTRAYRERSAHATAIAVHGDAALSGQGVVYETAQLSRLHGYETGGTIHVVLNNQIGFTADPRETRSTRYCTDLAKTLEAPVFHLNCEDPEGCIKTARVAARWHGKYRSDIFLEINGYRKYGHNETDEPNFTQPTMYREIKNRERVSTSYEKRLLTERTVSEKKIAEIKARIRETLEEALHKTKEKTGSVQPRYTAPPIPTDHEETPIETGLTSATTEHLKKTFCTFPKEFTPHPKIRRLFDERLHGNRVDWGMAEYLAYASLLREGIGIRFSGQDSGRGTFSHRHAILADQKTGERYVPLEHIAEEQGTFSIYNSPLSEYGVLGFEYGYSMVSENMLVIWEAQFGDFANGAQIIIDQYITSSKAKWNTTSSLTLLLPHGYEGMGPEHSSARIERFLQLAADHNVTLALPSTSAQMFHLLRHQGLTEHKRPLIIFSPKGLLRFAPSLSPLKELGEHTTFREVIDDPSPPAHPKRLFFCTGRVFYDLVEAGEQRRISDVAIIRIERLYPFPEQSLRSLIDRYPEVTSSLFVQEEPANMGAWRYIHPLLRKAVPERISLKYVGRRACASPAAGSAMLHRLEKEQFLREAFE
ncbi:MAG: 2-oxoglutarate dehydrogenase E1 component [Simkaniaceae bacterium]|nr:2-oxoglutarate dehydrogenase E1 component [Simkaniaceae bacterium]